MPKIPICFIGPSNYFKSGLTTYTMNLLDIFSKSQAFIPSALFLNKFVPKRLFPGKNRNIEDYPLLIPKNISYYNGLNWPLFPSLIHSLKFASSLPKNNVYLIQWWSSSALHLYLAFITLIKIICPESKIILEIHEVFDPLEQKIGFLGLYVNFFLPILLRRVDFLLFHSREEAREFSKRFYIPLSKIHLVKHIFPLQQAPAEKQIIPESNDIIILFFGLIRDYKGVPLLISAFNSLLSQQNLELKQKIKLEIVGEIWDQKKLIISLIQNSPFTKNISLVAKYIPDSEIEKYFGRANLLVLPYLRGTQSGVLNLGMTYSIPIIATNVGGFSTSLSNYEPKILIEPNSENALILALNTMIKRILSPTDTLKFNFQNSAVKVNEQYVKKIAKLALLPARD